jgi:hypothetical protein
MTPQEIVTTLVDRHGAWLDPPARRVVIDAVLARIPLGGVSPTTLFAYVDEELTALAGS